MFPLRFTFEGEPAKLNFESER